jgi:SAM-dependent methyltransferase
LSRHLERLRAAELEAVHPLIKAGARVLEIGGGSGFQASQLASLGCDVVSLDVSGSSPEHGRYHPVQLYDGVHIPFPNGSFDVVFSSNVLEHVRALPQLLRETQRVLDGAGIAIHILPTPAWRLWTSLAHYPFLVKYALRLNHPEDSCVPPLREAIGRKSVGYALRRALIAGPHGEFPSAVSELWYFSRRHWLRIFETAGAELLRDFPTGLFYSGYCLFPGIGIARRRMLARVLGSSCRVFVLRSSPSTRRPAD